MLGMGAPMMLSAMGGVPVDLTVTGHPDRGPLDEYVWRTRRLHGTYFGGRRILFAGYNLPAGETSGRHAHRYHPVPPMPGADDRPQGSQFARVCLLRPTSPQVKAGVRGVSRAGPLPGTRRLAKGQECPRCLVGAVVRAVRTS